MDNYDILEIWRLVTSFIFMYILNKYMNIFFISREITSRKKVIIWIMFYLIEYSVGEIIQTPIYIIVFNIICCTLLCSALFVGNIKEKLIWIATINVIGMMIEIFIGGIFLILNIDYGTNVSNEMLGSTISKVILFMFVMLCKKILDSKGKKFSTNRYWGIMFMIDFQMKWNIKN